MDLTRYDKLRSAIRRTLSPDEAAAADRALEYAAEHTASQVRHDGSPMLDHAAEVARIGLEEIGLGGDSVVAAILHDVVRTASRQDEETFLRLTDEIRDRFGKEVLGMTVSLSHISDIRLKASREQAENFRELIVSYSEDPRVILIKLADRLEVMRRLEIFPREKWRKKSWESLNLYAQIAHKLGLYNIKSELEDIALRYLEPQDYQHIADKLAETESERRAFIARFLEPITQRLDQAGLRYHVKSRTKSIFSIWNKMRKQHVPFEGVYDIFAIRIILDCPLEEEKQQCWTVYSIVTDFYTPNPERMRDWISIPKSNGYESLHTTVATKEGRWVEIQIRTERMDAVAERGIAAHWRYKGVNAGSDGSEMWMKQLRELMEDKTRPLAQNFDAKPSSGEIFVFTPGGDLRKLPEGATVLDFAFDIHTSLGLTCSGGKVNNRPAAIRDVLHNGDIVEVLTQKNQKPKADWLGFVTTSKARTRIKASLREEHTKNARLGREELERKLKNWKLPLTVDEGVGILCKHFKLRTGTELYASIGTEKIDLMQIKELLQAHLSGEAEEERRAAAAAIESEKRRKAEKVSTQSSGDALIIDEKIGQLDYKLAKCCNPIPGDEIVGFVTRGRGVTIHRTDCVNVLNLPESERARLIDAEWQAEDNGGSLYTVEISVYANNRTGLLVDISKIFTERKIDLAAMNVRTSKQGTASIDVTFDVHNNEELNSIIEKVRQVESVIDIQRSRG